MRNPYYARSEAPLTDNLVGKSYKVIQRVADNLDNLEAFLTHIELVETLATNLADLLAVADALEAIIASPANATSAAASAATATAQAALAAVQATAALASKVAAETAATTATTKAAEATTSATGANTAKTAAETAATNAASSATAANTSKLAAQTAETNAAGSATAAATSATASETSRVASVAAKVAAEAARDDAIDAKTAAEAAEAGVAADAAAAATSAADAADSATEAHNAEVTADGYVTMANNAKNDALLAVDDAEAARDEAFTFKDDAETAHDAAVLAQTGAETAETNAAASAADALTAQTAAEAAADTAGDEATAAASSASTATAQAGIATTKAAEADADAATVAADKAIVAADKATVAADKATVASDKAAAAASAAAALVSANDAASAQAATQALVDVFGDSWLGSHATAPTLDNDGSALDEGDLFWNSTTKQWGAWDDVGNQWVYLVGGSGGTAGLISFVSSGNLAATNVQAALEELDAEKVNVSDLDTDGTLAANSDSKVATQKATKTFVNAAISALSSVYQAASSLLGAIAGLGSNGFMVRTGSGSAAARSVAGTASVVSVSNGDGVSGNPTIDIATDGVDNTRLANMANATIKGRTTAGTGDPEDLTASQVRTLLGLVIGTNVQAYDADLTTWAGLTPSANAQSLVMAADYAAMRTLLGLVIGTNVQAQDAELAALAGLVSAANKIPYFTGSGTASLADFPASARTAFTAGFSTDVLALLDDANFAAMRTSLGLAIGSNVQAYDADLTTWAGLTPSANAQSLVTAADYAAMRTLLGLVIGTNVQAHNAKLAAVAALANASGYLKNDGSGNFSYDTPSGGGTTLLGTITTTSGSSQSLSSLDLTGYAGLRFVLKNVSGTAASYSVSIGSLTVLTVGSGGAAATLNGDWSVDLLSGYTANASLGNVAASARQHGYSQASTSVTVAITSGSFDAGSVEVYGIR